MLKKRHFIFFPRDSCSLCSPSPALTGELLLPDSFACKILSLMDCFDMEFKAIQESLGEIESKREQWLPQRRDFIQKMTSEIETAKAIMGFSVYPVDHKTVISELNQKFQALDALKWFEESWKDLKKCINDHRQVVNTTLIINISAAYRDGEYDQKILNRIIMNHCLREGMFDVLDCFRKEVGGSVTIPEREHFEAFYPIWNEVKAKNIDPALKWVNENKGVPKNGLDMARKLHLKLHRLKFVEIVQSGTSVEALEYAQDYLAPLYEFARDHMKGLMDCLLFPGSLNTSPCADMLDPIHLNQLGHALFKMFYDCLEQPFNDHLKVAVTAGGDALPTLLLQYAMAVLTGEDWQTIDLLSDPLPLRDEYQFHSVFICKMCDRVSTEENPPVRLGCGHVLCSDCVKEIKDKNRGLRLVLSAIRILRCPFCDVPSSYDDCLQLHFG